MQRPPHAVRRPERRRWAQNFLVNPAAVQRIIGAFAPTPEDRVLEIGPGRGALTAPLAGQVGRLLAVEIDPGLAADLEARLGAEVAAGRLRIVRADVLDSDLGALLSELAGGRPRGARVLANLPYNIATAVILRLIDRREFLRDLMVMVQREVAERIASPPGRKSYGGLSVLCQTHARVATILRLGPGSFRPAPKVESAVIHLDLYPAGTGGDPGDTTGLPALLRAAFGHRRKTLKNTLAALPRPSATGGPGGTLGTAGAIDLLRRAGIDPGARPEAIPPAGFLALLRAWHGGAEVVASGGGRSD